MKHYKTLSEMHRDNGWPPPENPLLGIVGCQSDCPLGDREFTADCYMIGFKKLKSGVILYGRTSYDHSNGAMMFVKPRQIIEMKNLELEEDGFMLLIHEDYLNGHELHSSIQKYGYFEYEVNEALHLSPTEEETVLSLYEKIKREYYNNTDEYSREIILSHIDSMLTYAQRFFKRQFINRTNLSGKTITKFNDALKKYMDSDLPKEQGLPSVNLLAKGLNISSRYLSDLLKQETGKTAIEHIHIHLVTMAKNMLLASGNNVSEIAYLLGFENSSYFTRLFKKQVGLNPLEFKKSKMGLA
ncbi:AraC family transcriptional regulator [Flavobacterium akiainvivens]|uniref:AraC family transcriptional regulator n=1 Tax=Flavobacterium akiainvivens TaxID=1202724 RepID=A0A0M8MAP4_9FLAO|nr:response regulator transcription factor [Flavobacterium akiainvivens]KOS06125.1 AraC family transcriptional regulator [Flavobacterium akiainvivens]